MRLDWIGWIATAVFAMSYLTREATSLRRVQGFAACLWAVYGALIHSLPIVVANVIVAGVAVTSSLRKPPAEVPQPAVRHEDT